jgi:hypothetical protein
MFLMVAEEGAMRADFVLVCDADNVHGYFMCRAQFYHLWLTQQLVVLFIERWIGGRWDVAYKLEEGRVEWEVSYLILLE